MRYILALILLACSVSFAQAQAPTQLCITTNGSNCIPSTLSFPFPERSGSYGIIQTPQYCQITVLSSAIKLTTANCSTGTVLTNSTIAQICVSTQGIRYTSSGVVTPTSTIGIPVASGTCFQYAGPLTTLTFIQQTSGAVLDIETFP